MFILSLTIFMKINHQYSDDKSTIKVLEKKLKELEGKLVSQNYEISEMRKKLNNISFSYESFEDDDIRSKFFTGLDTWNHLKIFYENIQSDLPSSNSKCSLTKWQSFILTLMKLRLNHSFKDLAYRFDIGEKTASRIFYSYLRAIYYAVGEIEWPENEAIRDSMPKSFKKSYGNSVVAIIDCFEIFTEKPADLEISAMFYSFYKSHHTVKFLIGKLNIHFGFSFISLIKIFRVITFNIFFTLKN